MRGVPTRTSFELSTPDPSTGAFGRPVSRRTVLLGGLAASLVPFGLSACSGGAGSSRSVSAAAATGTARNGGVLRVARPPASAAETLDPASSLSAYEYLAALYNRLVKQGEDGSTQPDLATHWETSRDAMTWTFTLREGVTFHDGKNFTSSDAAYTLEHILDPATKSPQAGVMSPFIDPAGISTPGPTTLVVKLKSPNAEFVTLLMNYNCYVIPEGSGASIGKSGIGTGPFKLASFEPAGKGVVEANPDYFDGRPVLDSIEFSAIADVQARVGALLAQQVDLVAQTNLDFGTASSVRASSTATTATVKNAQWYVMPMLCTLAPFTDVKVRQAFKLAYQPQELMDLAIHGLGTLANNNPVPPTDPNYLDYSVDPDPEEALALLKRAGLDPLKQVLYTSSYEPVLSPLAQAYQGSVKDAGITVELQTAPADSYYTDV